MEIITLLEEQMLGKKPFIEPIEGVVIAGGAIRKWFTGKEKNSDVDVFSSSESLLEKFKIEKLKDYIPISSTKNAATFKSGDKIVQLINGKLFNGVKEMFDNFDFTCCQFAWTHQGIYTTSKAIISTLREHLEVQKISKDFAVDSLRRAFKYQMKGFEPCWGTIRDLANSLRELTDEQIKNAVELSPAGGKRLVRFD
jgi:hypothetical protein